VKRRVIVWGVLVALALGGFLWLQIDPTGREIRRIQRRLTQLAETASFHEGDPPLKKFGYPGSISKYFTDPTELDVSAGERNVNGTLTRSQLEEGAAALRATAPGLKIEFLDIAVELETPPTRATAHLTAKIHFLREPDYAIQEFRLTLAKVETDWLVERIETVRTMER
jgi:hypothetical protein